MLVDKKKNFSLRWIFFHGNSFKKLYCFVNQDGCLVTWLQTKNIMTDKVITPITIALFATLATTKSKLSQRRPRNCYWGLGKNWPIGTLRSDNGDANENVAGK